MTTIQNQLIEMNRIHRLIWLVLIILTTVNVSFAKDKDKAKLPTIYERQIIDERGNRRSLYGYTTSEHNITDAIFDKAYPFSSNGLALIQRAGYFGYIMTNGEYFLGNSLRDARSFDEFGLAAVKEKSKWGLINSDKKYVLNDIFDKIEAFQPNGLAIVKYENKFGLVDTLGNVVLPVIYDKIEKFDNSGYATIKNGNKFGIVDKRGMAVVAPEHNSKKLALSALADLKSAMAKPDITLADLSRINKISSSENIASQPQKKEEQKASEKARKEEEQKLLAEKARKEEEQKLLAEKARKEEEQKLLAEKARKDEEQKLLAEEARKEERLLAEKARKEKEQKLLAEKARKEEEQKLLAEKARKEEEQKLLAEKARKEEEQKRQAEARKRLEQTPTLKNYIAANLGDWNDFLSAKNLNIPSEEEVRDIIEAEVGKWQVKGEFEPTAKWKERVNESTRTAKINAMADSILSINSQKVETVRAEYRKEYETLADRYCSGIAEQFASQSLVLKPYDADNETFLISTDDFGDFLLPVPLDEAPGFKQEWDKWKSTATASFVPNGEDVALKSVKISKYTYDSDMDATYAQVDVDYNFKPVDIARLNSRLDSGVDLAMHTGTEASGNKGIHTEKVRISAGSAADVDINIPTGKEVRKNTFALVIANGNYDHASHVDHAENDGQVMAQYLTQTLGIPENNVVTVFDATYGKMASAISMLQQIGDVYSGTDFNLIFYYVGHGLPDDEGSKSYILPVDIDPRMVSICMPLEKIYADLGNLGAKNVTVMVDACFSGTNHGDGMLVPQSLGVARRPKKADPVGNMVVLTAAEGNETAFPYQEKSHGLFTYWLLKKLQETAGEVTFGELSDYVIDNVKKTSVTINHKPQTPTVATSPRLTATWRSMPFGR